MRRSLAEISADIKANWKNVSPYAAPYLTAMSTMHVPGANYLLDSEKSVILYFLSNASSWRGAEAKRIKDELKAIAKA